MKTLENFACYDQFKKTIQGMRATKKEFEDGQQYEALTNQRDGREYKKLKWTALHTSKCIQEAVFLLKEEEPSLSKEQLKKNVAGRKRKHLVSIRSSQSRKGVIR